MIFLATNKGNDSQKIKLSCVIMDVNLSSNTSIYKAVNNKMKGWCVVRIDLLGTVQQLLKR